MKATLAAGALAVFMAPTAAAWIYTSANQAELHPIVAPTERPNVTTTDPWTCVTESVRERYFDDNPRPTGALDKAMISFGSQLLETCKTSGTYSRPCAFPDKTRWCGVTTALPASLLPAYSAYASNASAWWAAHSSRAVEVAQVCPLLWYETGNFGVLGGAVRLNHTLINAECYAEAHVTAGAGGTGPTATPGQRAASGGSTPTPTQTAAPKRTDSAPNGVGARGQADGGQMWAVAASGLAAAWANVAL